MSLFLVRGMGFRAPCKLGERLRQIKERERENERERREREERDRRETGEREREMFFF